MLFAQALLSLARRLRDLRRLAPYSSKLAHVRFFYNKLAQACPNSLTAVRKLVSRVLGFQMQAGEFWLARLFDR